ncbi:MAG: hypothetical protein GXP62_14025, partial [Oligoflexia bacterium]|nr:hypothetical protein [Oligoflexia bacterium]
MTRHRLPVPRLPIAADGLGFFRFGQVGRRVILTTDAGEWHMLDSADFRRLVDGSLPADHPAQQTLQSLGILRQGSDLDAIAARVRRKKEYLGQG